MTEIYAPRVSWPSDFPKVVIHTSVSARDAHPAYADAKAGDAFAAFSLVKDLLKQEAVEQLRDSIGGRRVILAAVTAVERNGFNAIPDAMALMLGTMLGAQVDVGELRQNNVVLHTRASGWHRIVTPAGFAGEVEPGRDYVIVDDHVGLGGTIANIRGYIEKAGGRVIAVTCLTESRDAATIALTPETLDILRTKHGHELEKYWHNTFGYGLDCLTQVEGGYIARQPSLDAIAGSMAKAAEEAGSGGLPPISLPGIKAFE